MTTTPTQTGTGATPAARRVTRPGRKKGEGQWALGYREPLNPNEQSKKDDNPLHVRARIENIYAKRGFASIDPGDLRGRFRWYGLYTQRRPGIDGGKTATLEPWELDDEYFMLRIRIDGGALTTEQLRVIGEIAVEFARDTADITDRQNVQLHWIRIEDVPEIWRRLEAVGLHRRTRRLPPRHPWLPVAGIAADEIIDPSQPIRDIADRYIGDPQFSTSRAVQDRADWRAQPMCAGGERCRIRRCRAPSGPGFDVWVGGGLSTNPMLASRWRGCPATRSPIPPASWGCSAIRLPANQLGRIKFLVADWGPEKFRQVLKSSISTPADRWSGAGDTRHRATTSDQLQKDGRHGLAATAGRTGGKAPLRLAEIAGAHARTDCA
jgi:sulfite reductase (ferredoxin)